jgi:hypothetical protein
MIVDLDSLSAIAASNAIFSTLTLFIYFFVEKCRQIVAQVNVAVNKNTNGIVC